MAKRPRISLTRLEQEIMRAVWDGPDASVRVRDAVEAVNAGRDRPLAYNTVQTVLNILRDKGAVEVTEGPGRAHVYRARLSRTDASRGMVRDLIDRLFDGRAEPLLQHLIEDQHLGAEELRRLRRMVNARLRDAGEKRP